MSNTQPIGLNLRNPNQTNTGATGGGATGGGATGGGATRELSEQEKADREFQQLQENPQFTGGDNLDIDPLTGGFNIPSIPTPIHTIYHSTGTPP